MPRAGHARSEQHGLIALLGASVAVRLAYLLEYVHLPFLWGPLFDSRVYLQQAAAIRANRLDDPTLVAFSPLYGWFLALFEDGSLEAPVHVQLVLGCLNVAMVHRIGLSLGGRTAGLVAGGAYSAYGLFVFHETKLLSETLALSVLLAAMALWSSRRFDRGQHGTTAAAGVLLGLALLARSSLVLSAPFFVVAAALPWSAPSTLDARRRLLRAGVLLAGMLAPLAINGASNYVHTGLFVPVTLASSTAARATAQSPHWTGDVRALRAHGAPDVSPWDVVREADARIANARAGRHDATPLAGIDLIGWARGAPAKIVATFADTETTAQYGYYGERTEITTLRALPLSFGAIAVGAVVGALILVRRRGVWAIVPWLPLVLGAIALGTLFHPSSRYRLPMAVPLVVLGGYAVAQIASARSRLLRGVGGGLLALVVGAFALRLWTYELRAPGLWELRVAESAAATGDREEASRRIERARRLAPDDPTVLRNIERITQGWGSGAPR